MWSFFVGHNHGLEPVPGEFALAKMREVARSYSEDERKKAQRISSNEYS